MSSDRPFGLLVEPACSQWAQVLEARSAAATGARLFEHSLADWQRQVRAELGLDVTRPVIATGHQSLLWHPGILVKYMFADAIARRHGFATANLIVDQHAGSFGDLDIPLRRRDGALSVRRLVLTAAPRDIPMALHEPFMPPDPPPRLPVALPEVEQGIVRIHDAIARRRDAPNAAIQMGRALADLMARWVSPMPNVTTTDLVDTSLSRAMLAEMARDPVRAARTYNTAVASVPEAGIGPLLIRDDYVEVPLWRIRSDGRRMHAYDNDLHTWLAGEPGAPRLMPRALFMTALIRLGMCDLFVHGTGGARYDVAMERWVESWLGVQPAPIVVATATLRLPLLEGDAVPSNAEADALLAGAHRVWHDPERAEPHASHANTTEPARGPGPIKRELLDAIEAAPWGSTARRNAFFAMHAQLQQLRGVHAGSVERIQRAANDAAMRRVDAEIAGRRDWAFPLYPEAMLDELAAVVAAAGGLCAQES